MNAVNAMNDTVLTDPAPGRTTHTRPLALVGALAVVAAVTLTTLAAALARSLGADLEIPDGGERIPLSGIAVVTGLFSTVGVVLAATLRRWSARPAQRFVQTTVALTAISLVPPFVVGAAPTTALTLVALHLVAAAVMIPTLAASLRSRAA